jgi:hypothetical protein
MPFPVAPEDRAEVAAKALLAAAAGMGLGYLADRVGRQTKGVPWTYDPTKSRDAWMLGHPVAAPLLRGATYAVPLAVLAATISSLKKSDLEGFGKFSSQDVDPTKDYELWKEAALYELVANKGTLIPELNSKLDLWAGSFVKGCSAAPNPTEAIHAGMDKVAIWPLLLGLPFALMGLYGAGKSGGRMLQAARMGAGKEALKHLGMAGLNLASAVPMVGWAGRGLLAGGKGLQAVGALRAGKGMATLSAAQQAAYKGLTTPKAGIMGGLNEPFRRTADWAVQKIPAPYLSQAGSKMETLGRGIEAMPGARHFVPAASDSLLTRRGAAGLGMQFSPMFGEMLLQPNPYLVP